MRAADLQAAVACRGRQEPLTAHVLYLTVVPTNAVNVALAQ